MNTTFRKLDYIVFPAVITVAFMTNFWFGILILFINLSIISVYVNSKYIRWSNYFRAHLLLFATYLTCRLISKVISTLIQHF